MAAGSIVSKSLFFPDLHLWSCFLSNDWPITIWNTSSRDGIFVKDSRRDASRQCAQVWNLKSTECRTASPRSHDGSVTWPECLKEGWQDQCYWYTCGKVIQRSTTDQVVWLHLRPGLVRSHHNCHRLLTSREVWKESGGSWKQVYVGSREDHSKVGTIFEIFSMADPKMWLTSLQFSLVFTSNWYYL